MRTYRLAFVPLLFAIVCLAQGSPAHEEFEFVRHQIQSSPSFVPKGGYVPDKETAISIAYAIAIPVYGRKTVNAERPFRAELKDGSWTVLGTLHNATVGGTIIVQIDEKSGRVLYLNHSM